VPEEKNETCHDKKHLQHLDDQEAANH